MDRYDLGFFKNAVGSSKACALFEDPRQVWQHFWSEQHRVQGGGYLDIFVRWCIDEVTENLCIQVVHKKVDNYENNMVLYNFMTSDAIPTGDYLYFITPFQLKFPDMR